MGADNVMRAIAAQQMPVPELSAQQRERATAYASGRMRAMGWSGTDRDSVLAALFAPTRSARRAHQKSENATEKRSNDHE